MDRIKISREFKDSILGGLWLGLERDIPEDCEDISGEFKLANDQLIAAYQNLGSAVTYGVSTPESYDGIKSKWYAADEAPLVSPTPKEKRKEEVVASLMLAIELASSKTATEFFRKRVEDISDKRLTEAFNTKLKQFT